MAHWLAEPNQLYSSYVIFSGIWVPFFLFSLKIRSNILIAPFCTSWLVNLFTHLYRKISRELTKGTTSQTIGYMTVISGVKRCNLTVETFETMGKLQANYNYHLHQQARASGKSIRHRHAHMHTCNKPGLNIDLSADLETNFTWTPPLAAWQTKISLEGPEAITDEELEAAFAELEQRNSTDAQTLDLVIEGDEIEAGRVYDLDEFARVEKGVIPSTFEDDVEVVVPALGDTNWDIDTILLSKGVSSA